MGLETANYIHQLNSANPSGPDRLASGDDHIRLIKQALKATFPNLTGPVTLTQEQINTAPSYATPVGIITLWYGSDTAVPTGWAICNGQTVPKTDLSGNITLPDLRGRVPFGADADHATGASFGTATRSLTLSTVAAHSHTASSNEAGTHDHGGSAGGTTLGAEHIPAHTHSAFTSGAEKPGTAITSTTTATVRRTSGGDSDYWMMEGNGSADVGKTSSVGGGQAHSHSISAGGGHTHNITVEAAGGHTHTVADFDVYQPALALHFIMKI